MAFLDTFYRVGEDRVVEDAKYLLKHLLNVNHASFPVTNKDTKYLVIYMCIAVFLHLEQYSTNGEMPSVLSVTTSYLLTVFKDKINLNMMTPEQATFHFQHERELRKQKLMQMYKGMDDSIRHLNKKAVDMGLLTRDDLLRESEAAEEVEIRLENERDDYDMNERED
jgi:hypothetical protein